MDVPATLWGRPGIQMVQCVMNLPMVTCAGLVGPRVWILRIYMMSMDQPTARPNGLAENEFSDAVAVAW